jgi:hypothetical protein
MTPRAVAQIKRLRRAIAAGEPLHKIDIDEEVVAACHKAELRPSTFIRKMGRVPRLVGRYWRVSFVHPSWNPAWVCGVRV